MILRMGNDHTNGTTPGKLAPLSSFADNDYALGMLVEGVSKSGFWPSTAIFVIEDDAQNGPDHVDSHRSPMLAISPYTHRGIIDSSMYNQSSIMRTMELILGMRPHDALRRRRAAADRRFRRHAQQCAVHGRNAAHFAHHEESGALGNRRALRADGF